MSPYRPHNVARAFGTHWGLDLPDGLDGTSNQSGKSLLYWMLSSIYRVIRAIAKSHSVSGVPAGTSLYPLPVTGDTFVNASHTRTWWQRALQLRERFAVARAGCARSEPPAATAYSLVLFPASR